MSSGSSSSILNRCDCKLPLVLRTSRTSTNLGRRFLVCPNSGRPGKKCTKFHWLDPELDNTWYIRQLFELYTTMKEMQGLEEITTCKVHELELQKSKLESEMLQLRLEMHQAKSSVGYYKICLLCLLVVFVVIVVKNVGL